MKKLLATTYGFTLLELLIAIAIVAIIGAVILPVYQSARPSLRLNTTARDLVADLRLVQQEAVTQQILHGIVFDVNTNQYRIINLVDNATIKTVYIPAPVILATTTGLTAATVSYYATGAVADSGTVIIGNGNTTSTIEIKPSGYVKIIE